MVIHLVLLFLRLTERVDLEIELLFALHGSAHLAVPRRLLDIDRASELLRRHLALEHRRTLLTHIHDSCAGQGILLRGILDQLRDAATVGLAHGR